MGQIFELLFSFSGRIGRRSWWIGLLIILVIALAGTLLISRYALTPLGLVTFLPAVAITLKRLRDRGHPELLGYIWAVLGTILYAFFRLGAFGDLLAQPLWFWALVAIGFPFGLWVFIDCAFLRGEQGTNKYGPDPRDAVMRDVRFEDSERRYAASGFGFGAMLRNVIVAAAAFGVAFLFMGPSATLSALLTRVVEGKQWVEQTILDPLDLNRDGLYENPEAWGAFMLGKVSAIEGNQWAAVRYYTQAARGYGAKSKLSAPILVRRGQAQDAMARRHKAMLDYTFAIAIDPYNAEAYFERGKARTNVEIHEDALADFDKAIGLDPNNARSYFERAKPLNALGRIDDASASYSKCAELARKDLENEVGTVAKSTALKPDIRDALVRSIGARQILLMAQAHTARGVLLRDQLRGEDALVAFNDAIAAKPDHGPAFRHRGWLHEAEGRTRQALSDYRKAASLTPASRWLKRAIQRAERKASK